MKVFPLPISTAFFILIASIVSLSIAPAARAGVGDPGTIPSISNTPGTTEIPPGATEIAPIGVTSSINQQAGVIQNNGLGSYGSLSYPSCSGVCVFAIGRATRTGNSATSIEAVGGVVWQISSPENTYAQNARILAETQQSALNNQSTLSLSEKLAEAIETNKPERANAIAMILAPRMGYKDYRQLLRDIRNVR
jgi:hypothetical protein